MKRKRKSDLILFFEININLIKYFYLDCSYKAKITNGQISLDDYNNVTVGATATVNDCNLGYKINKPKVTCLNTGEWDQTGCTVIGRKAVFFLDNILYILTANLLSFKIDQEFISFE